MRGVRRLNLSSGLPLKTQQPVWAAEVDSESCGSASGAWPAAAGGGGLAQVWAGGISKAPLLSLGVELPSGSFTPPTLPQGTQRSEAVELEEDAEEMPDSCPAPGPPTGQACRAPRPRL